MKQESHRLLGRYLLAQMDLRIKHSHETAFLIGCVEPDRNPLTYLKGSIRERWFYGHNYQNSCRWIARTIRQLQSKANWNIYDYYRLGKLIHYTSDAFTYVHNNCFLDTVRAHRDYETILQAHFLCQLQEVRAQREAFGRDVVAAFTEKHEKYLNRAADVKRDTRYILEMTMRLFCHLLPDAELCEQFAVAA